MRKNSELIYTELNRIFPDAHCELNYSTPFQLCVAVVLSAQTTDKAVNKVTGNLFEKYPDAFALSKAELDDVKQIIKAIGLYHNKAKNIISLSKQVVEQFDGILPNTMEQLTTLSGVGRKSANVILSECFNQPAIAVDTHVERIAKRLKIAKTDDSVLEVEKKMQKYFPKDKWSHVHHLFIFFGRYLCSSRTPDCANCPFTEICRDYKKIIKERESK